MTKPLHLAPELARIGLPLAFVFLVAAAVAGVTTPFFRNRIVSRCLVIVAIRALFPAAIARVLASLEVFCGIMLLLLGVSELLE